MKRHSFYWWSPLLLLASCIGIDVLDWETMDPRVVINTRLETLAVGETFQLEADYFDTLGAMQTAEIDWSSSDGSVISVDANGLLEAHTQGEAMIFATVGVAQDTLTITAGDETVEMTPERVANLVGLGNYNARGTATLQEQTDGSLRLIMSDNFQTDNGPGLFIYLSNQSRSVSGGVEVAALAQTSGGHSYSVPSEVSLSTYNYILIYCKPFGVPFANGEFAN